ncbi:tail fiber domain-containing protein [Novosphingobium sp.]|uniref:tail fiber domain-containing protein n=1 Tax=Novosphingobium sp. TaxID=1874826 RepID=UPI0031D31C7D
MSTPITITAAGRAALINASHTGTNALVIAAIGLSTSAVTGTPLPGEFKKVTAVGGLTVAADMIHVTMTDASADAYSARSIGIYLSDGTLFAVYGQADPILTKTAASQALLAVDIQLADNTATSITFGATEWLNPPATTTTAGVVRLATTPEAQAGAEALAALTPATAIGAVLGWLLRQDGAGSALDADLLDGQHGSWYADIAARLGYTPVNRAGDTMSGSLTAPSLLVAGSYGTNGLVAGNGDAASYSTANAFLQLWNGLAFRTFDGSINGFYDARSGLFDVRNSYRVNGVPVWHPNNDGAGSGLDAGLLAGQLPGFYTDITGRLGYTPVRQGGGTGQLANTVFIGWGNNGRLKAQVDSTDMGNLVTDDTAGKAWINFNGWAMRRNGQDLWGPDNDGAGSGLDAGLFAGQLPSYYTSITDRLGYVPANRAGDTFTGPIRRDNGFYFDLSGGVTPLINFDDQDYMFYDRANNVLKIIIANAVRMIMPLSGNLDFYSSTAQAFLNGLMLWHAGNDGAGSGLDAGLLAGVDPSAYARRDQANTFMGNALFQSGVYFGATTGGVRIAGNGNRLSFYNDASLNERMAISQSDGAVQISGARGIGASDIQGSGALRVMTPWPGGYGVSTYDTQDYRALQFVRQVSGDQREMGTITVTDGGVFLNSVSDHRLKDEVRAIEDPEATIMAYRPCEFTMIASGKRMNGFIAHEFAEVNPDAVQGVKDGEVDIGTAQPLMVTSGTAPAPLVDITEAQTPAGWSWEKTGTRPVYQTMDATKAMPEVIAALQIALTRTKEQQAQIDALLAEVAALKAA